MRFPCYKKAAPGYIKGLIDYLANELFDQQYDSNTGIVKFNNPQIFPSGQGEITHGRKKNPHISFFTSTNPGHELGDELVCIAEISKENQTAIGRRIHSLSRPVGLTYFDPPRWNETTLQNTSSKALFS